MAFSRTAILMKGGSCFWSIPKMPIPLVADVGVQFHTPVKGPALQRVIGGGRPGCAESDGPNPAGGNALLYEIIADSLGPRLRKLLIVFS